MALYLYLYTQREDFEAVFADTGCEWPETYEYINAFNRFIGDTLHRPPITVITAQKYGFPAQKNFDGNMYAWYLNRRTIPGRRGRDCSVKWKIKPKENYFKTPCWNHIAIDYGEKNRVARFKSTNGIEDRFPLIEAEIDRQGCKDLIRSFKIKPPPKSACYFCFNTKPSEWKTLRTKHPDLWCNALTLERVNNERRKQLGLKQIGLGPQYRTIEGVVDEHQMALFEEDEYPPCQCGL